MATLLAVAVVLMMATMKLDYFALMAAVTVVFVVDVAAVVAAAMTVIEIVFLKMALLHLQQLVAF